MAKYNITKKQICVIWVSISILLPLFYLAGKRIIAYNRAIQCAKRFNVPGASHLQPVSFDDQPLEYRSRAERRIDAFVIAVFEIVSATGLVLYVLAEKKPI